MKKCYKAPETVVVDLDLECVCVDGSITAGESGDVADAAQVRDSYRSSLWND